MLHSHLPAFSVQYPPGLMQRIVDDLEVNCQSISTSMALEMMARAFIKSMLFAKVNGLERENNGVPQPQHALIVYMSHR